MSSSVKTKSAVHTPRGRHTATFIFLHGLGDVAGGWFSEFVAAVRHAFSGGLAEQLKIVCPQAPSRPITLNGGMVMPGWYDITTLTDDRAAQPCDGIEEARAILDALIEEELSVHKIPAQRVIIGGFSQGAAVSLYTGYQSAHTLGGVVAMSGYLARRADVLAGITAAAKQTPLLMCHGVADSIVRYSWGKESFQTLQAAGLQHPVWREYPDLDHSANETEMAHVLDFLRSRLADSR